MKVRLWLCATPLLVPMMTALLDWLKGTSASPPPLPIEPGSVRVSVPELSATLEEPVMPLVSALPSQLDASFPRSIAPTRWVLMSRR